MTETTLRIVRAIKSIPRGKVSSYRDVALAAGLPNGARQTVRVLHSLSEKMGLPWHRVIRCTGSIALAEGEGRELQISLLRAEGVKVSAEGKVDMEQFGFLQKSLSQRRIEPSVHGAKDTKKMKKEK